MAVFRGYLRTFLQAPPLHRFRLDNTGVGLLALVTKLREFRQPAWQERTNSGAFGVTIPFRQASPAIYNFQTHALNLLRS